MILKRYYDEKLAQASYLVGCAGSSEAVVIDPIRDAGQYVRAAESEDLKIVAVTETHIHADFASGSRELVAATGARLYLSDEGDADWKYDLASEASLLRHGDSFRLGAIRFDVIRTPGHTPEHISFVVTDEAASSEPWGVFTGDFLFVGDVGRPDLLENAAGIAGTAEAGARDLFRSLQEIKQLPDHVLIWPGHGAGSACGKSLGGVPVTSLGYEKRSNWALKAATEGLFNDEVLAGQPDPPRYFAEMKRLNKAGPPLLGGLPKPARQKQFEQLKGLIAEGAVVLDIRSSEEHLAGRVPGTLHIPLYRNFTNWAGWLVPYRTEIYLLASIQEQAEEAARDLAMIGLDDVRGWFGPDALVGERLERVSEIEPVEAHKKFRENEMRILDVRSMPEYEAGHVPGAIHIPLGRLPQRAAELPRDKPLAVHCQSGVRSPIGVSILRNAGFDVVNVIGGFGRYADGACPIERGQSKDLASYSK